MRPFFPIWFSALLVGCGGISEPPAPAQPYDISRDCTLERSEGGWVLNGQLASPRREDPIGATYVAFTLEPTTRSIEQVRDRARRIAEVLTHRALAPEALALDPSRSDGRTWWFTGDDLFALYDLADDRLMVRSTATFPDVESGAPVIDSSDAFLRHRCTVARLEASGLIEAGAYPPERATMSRTINAVFTSGDPNPVAQWTEAFRFGIPRYFDDVVGPGSLSVEVHASGALREITLATPQVGFAQTLTRQSTWSELQARFAEETSSRFPGQQVILGATPLVYRELPTAHGNVLAPVQQFWFVVEGVPSRGGWQWSYRIDDPDAAAMDP